MKTNTIISVVKGTIKFVTTMTLAYVIASTIITFIGAVVLWAPHHRTEIQHSFVLFCKKVREGLKYVIYKIKERYDACVDAWTFVKSLTPADLNGWGS